MSVLADELLQAAQQGDQAAREKLICDNSRLIWSIVRRYTGRGAEPDDLYQLGCIGFLKAIDGFDTAFGTRFSTYAVPKIAGEMRRFLRDDGAVKVSRGVKELAGRIRAARGELCARWGREPTVGELAEFLELPAEEVAAAETATAAVTSLQSETGEGMTLESVLGDDGMEEHVVERVALRGAVDQLPEKERMVVILRFYRGMTQQKAAQVVGVSQVQVSRLERRAMEHLRRLLE